MLVEPANSAKTTQHSLLFCTHNTPFFLNRESFLKRRSKESDKDALTTKFNKVKLNVALVQTRYIHVCGKRQKRVRWTNVSMGFGCVRLTWYFCRYYDCKTISLSNFSISSLSCKKDLVWNLYIPQFKVYKIIN